MIVIVSQLLIYQRVRLCANLLWSDLGNGVGHSPDLNREVVPAAEDRHLTPFQG